ncbi:MAG: CxxC-x17-CxxC domain-containing protein [Candidatus Hodarchaeales archaeon]|jgi:CxxC-x17-CxxC domain-containing protein
MGFGNSYTRAPREMHTVKCADCGVDAEVPFKPDGTRPVYCQECYRKRRPRRSY